MCDDPYHSDCKTAAGMWALLVWVVAILVMVALYGCSPQRLEVPAWSIPAGAVEEASSDTSAIAPGEWPEEAWWREFNDPQLEELITQGLTQNPRIDIADTQALIALSEAGITRSRLYPHLSFEGDITRYRYSKNGIFGTVPAAADFPFSNTQYEFSLNFAYEIDWWGKQRDALRAALGEVQARCAETAQARLLLSASIARTYYLLQMQMARAAIAEERVKNYAQRLELIKFRAEQNVDALLAVNTSRSDYHEAVEVLRYLEQNIDLEKNALSALLAGGFNENIQPVDFTSQPLCAFEMPSRIELDLLARRPDIVAQMWRVQSAINFVDVARKQFYPNLNILGLVGMQTLHANTWLKNESKYGQGGPAIHLPLFEGGALLLNLEVRKDEYAIAVYQYENTLINALKEVLDGIAVFKKQAQRNQELEQVAQSNQLNWSLTQERQEHNISSELDVLRAQDGWLLSLDSLIQGRTSSLIARINLINALGGGYDSNPITNNPTCDGETLARSNP